MTGREGRSSRILRSLRLLIPVIGRRFGHAASQNTGASSAAPTLCRAAPARPNATQPMVKALQAEAVGARAAPANLLKRLLLTLLARGASIPELRMPSSPRPHSQDRVYHIATTIPKRPALPVTVERFHSLSRSKTCLPPLKQPPLCCFFFERSQCLFVPREYLRCRKIAPGRNRSPNQYVSKRSRKSLHLSDTVTYRCARAGDCLPERE